MPSERQAGIRSLFEPRSVAVAGVSTDPNKLGSIIFANLATNSDSGLLKAPVYALNPGHDRIGGRPCYPSIGSLPETPELLVVAVPVSLTPDLIREAALAGVRSVIIVTSGYSEAGRKDVEDRIKALASEHHMRVLGPNTIGLLDTVSGMDSLFLRPTKSLPDGSEVVSLLKPLKGEVAVLTQSGHLGEIVSELLAAQGVGIRALVGTGNQLDVSIEDVIGYFADDPKTKVIAVYLEGVRDGRRFMKAASAACRKKPLVVLKVGKTGTGAKAALTHTASLVGDYAVYQAAFRRCGIVEAAGLQELVDYCVAFSMLPKATGRRLLIVTNAGGVGALAADEAESSGLKVSPLSSRTQEALQSAFRGSGFISNAALGNPIDLTASVGTEDFVKITGKVLGTTEYDLALLLPTHQAPAISHDVSAQVAAMLARTRKAACVCVMGQSELASSIHSDFMKRGIPSFPSPERAVRAMSAVVSYGASRLRPRPTQAEPRRAKDAFPITESDGLLSFTNTSRLLRHYGLSQPKSRLVRTADDLKRPGAPGFPVACKLMSKDLIHKTDAGGVILGVEDKASLALAFRRLSRIADSRGARFDGMLVQEMVGKGVELLLGGTRDPIFGPVVLFGEGGTKAEVSGGHALAIAPVTTAEAADVVRTTRLAPVLEGYRGGSEVDVGKLCGAISRFSRILIDNPSIQQLEVNPMTATREALMCVDARVVVSTRKG